MGLAREQLQIAQAARTSPLQMLAERGRGAVLVGVARDEVPLQIHGWRLYAHPLFLDQLNALINEVESLRRRDPQDYRSRNASKDRGSWATSTLLAPGV